MASPKRFYEARSAKPLPSHPFRSSSTGADGIIAAGEVLFADVLLLPNGMSKVGAYV